MGKKRDRKRKFKEFESTIPGALKIADGFYNLSQATGPLAEGIRAAVQSTLEPGEKDRLAARWDQLSTDAKSVAVALTYLVCHQTRQSFIGCSKCRAAVLEAGAAAVERKVDLDDPQACLEVLAEVSALLHGEVKAAD